MSIRLKEFNMQVNIAIPYLTAQNDRLLVPTALYDKLTTALTSWNALWGKSQDPATRTPMIVGNLNELRETFSRDYRLMQQSLKHSAEVVLTEQDHEELFIHKDKRRSRIPAPSIIPRINITGRAERKIKIQVSSPEATGNHRKLPKGVRMVNIFTAITEVNDTTMPAAADYRLFTSAGKSNIELVFDAAHEKKTAHVKAGFVNAKGQSGPLSDPIDAIIPD